MATRSPNAWRKSGGGGGRQRDFRHEHQHAPAGGADRGREADVDLGLAAAGDAVQQGDAELAGGGEREEPVEGGGLLAGQLARGVRPGSDTHPTAVTAAPGSDGCPTPV